MPDLSGIAGDRELHSKSETLAPQQQEAPQNRSLGIVGAGDIVTRLHLPVLEAMPNLRIAWIADARQARAAAVGAAYKVPSIAMPADLEQLPQADVVLLAIPYGARAPYFAALGGDRCALYVEKPFAKTVAEHLSLCQGRAPSRIACGFQRRAMTSVNLVRSLIEEQFFGALEHVEFGLGRRGQVRSGTHQSDVALAGGGMFFETGVHGLDAILYITGATDAQLQSASVTMLEGFEVHVDAAFRIASPREPSVPCRLAVSCLEDTIESFRFVFERAELRFSMYNNEPIRVRSRSGDRRFTIGRDGGGCVATFYQTAFAYWRAFLDGLASQSANWTSASDSVLTTKLVEQIFSQPHREL